MSGELSTCPVTRHRDSVGVGTTWSDASAASETEIRVKLSRRRLQNDPLNLLLLPCVRPAPNYYFPTLHHLKFEMEDGVTPNSRPVRFGFNQQEFPDFSWRGYAVMSPAQVRTDSAPILPRTLLNTSVITFLPVFPPCDWSPFTSALLFLLKTQPQPTG